MGATMCAGNKITNGEVDLDDIEESPTTSLQLKRPKRLILIRHGQSEGNVKRSVTQTVPDHALHLTMKGREQAAQAGQNLRNVVGGEGVKFLVSPYIRAVETMNGIAQAWGGKDRVDIREDAYIREQDFGNFDKPEARELHKEKKTFGKFYYRFPEGESPADVYNRAGLFLESLYRRWETNYVDNTVIVSHELFIVVFLMRLFRYPIRDYYEFDDLANGGLIVLERPPGKLHFDIAYTWAPGADKRMGGLPRKTGAEIPDIASMEMWDGSPEAPLLESMSRK